MMGLEYLSAKSMGSSIVSLAFSKVI